MESFGLSITKKITIQGFILLAITVAIFAINKQYELVALVIISKFSGKITKDLYGKRLAEIIERGGIW